MEFALMTEPQLGGTYDDLLWAARWAERAGMTTFARSDHLYFDVRPRPAATEAFTTLAGLARETERIRLCLLVTPITFRHPAIIAKSAATIDAMSGGRLDLGVGTGWMDLEHAAFGLPFPDTAERFDRLEEALGYLTAAFAPGHASFEGRHYRLDADVAPRPTGLRLVVGGSGAKRTPALAARFADELNHPLTSPAEILPKITTMRERAADAGRDPATIVVSVMGAVVAGRTDEEYRTRLEATAGRLGRRPDELERRLVERGVPHGTPGRIAEALAALEETGVTKLYLQWLDLADRDGLAATFAAVAG